MALIDPHSCADSDQPRTRHLALSLSVDFAAKRLEGDATLVLAAPSGGPLDLDAKGLEVRSVVTGTGTAVPFSLGPSDPILGERLRLELPPGTEAVTVRYATSPGAAALQWLAPEQTAGRQQPFLFSQCQAIHARSMVPVQDTARIRVTYEAAVTVPDGLVAVMSAGPDGVRPGAAAGTTTYLFRMPQAIPTYLIALAVGSLEGRDLSPRSRVWAEPEIVDAAAWEFAGIEEMIVKAEGLFGPYDWDRYDMLVLPPSFPYGGMENPRMTFLTPTLLSGDRSLVDVVAHELAHSWTGNLVTNATAEDFWLNEGFTVWAERRILEAIHGPEAAVLGWAIGQKALDESIARFGATSPLTRLKTQLAGIDPDEAFSSVPYEKGARLVALMERTAGREAFDRFLRSYMDTFRFTSISTEEFLAFLDAKLPGVSDSVQARKWFYEPGMPGNAPVFRSAALEGLTALAEGWASGARPTAAQMAEWTPPELQIYLQHLPREMDRPSLDWLEKSLGLTARGNHEILVEWLVIAGGSGYEPVFPRIREVLTRVGRMKYLRPLYTALGRHEKTRALAAEIFAAASAGYHQLSARVVASAMAKYPA